MGLKFCFLVRGQITSCLIYSAKSTDIQDKELISVENACVAFVKGADERNKYSEKINNQ